VTGAGWVLLRAGGQTGDSQKRPPDLRCGVTASSRYLTARPSRKTPRPQAGREFISAKKKYVVVAGGVTPRGRHFPAGGAQRDTPPEGQERGGRAGALPTASFLGSLSRSSRSREWLTFRASDKAIRPPVLISFSRRSRRSSRGLSAMNSATATAPARDGRAAGDGRARAGTPLLLLGVASRGAWCFGRDGGCPRNLLRAQQEGFCAAQETPEAPNPHGQPSRGVSGRAGPCPPPGNATQPPG